jgi:hypothetical protein
MADERERRAWLVSLRQRVAAARAQSTAVCADAAATLQSIRRDVAARRGRQGESDTKVFVPARHSRSSR